MDRPTYGEHRLLVSPPSRRVERGARAGGVSAWSRTILLASLALLVPHGLAAQPLSVLRVTVTLLDAAGQVTPVPRHALLISDEPPTDSPRRVVTGLDGRVEIRLRPGAYTVESDRPVALGGRLYHWRQLVEIAGDGNATLELNGGNAEVEAGSSEAAPAAPAEGAPGLLLPRWQDSVVAIWTPTTRVSGFVTDARGLVVTSRAALGDATPVAVQLTPMLKVPARVLAADPGRRVAVLWINPAAAASVTPVPLQCPSPTPAPVADGQELFTIGAALRGLRDLAIGAASVRPDGVEIDFDLESGAEGGPVFTAAGNVVGLTTPAGEADDSSRGNVRVIGVPEVCQALASAAKAMSGAEAPPDVRLPVEPERAPAPGVLEAAAPRRIGSLAPYQASSADFDVTFVTPLVAYAAQRWLDQERTGGGVSPELAWERQRLLTDFGTWSEYFRDVRPVLLVRATPKMAEGFWAKVARGAASTQGISLPPLKRRKAGFARMRVLCGSAEVTPIHPFTTDARGSEGDAIREGLYVFDPGALGPHCGTVTLELSSEKAPDRGETLVVDPKVIEKAWQDFAPAP